MAMSKRRSDFLDSEEGQEIMRTLQNMASSGQYNTGSSYSANSTRYPDNQIPFVDKHMNYLIDHPKLEPNKYLANIKLMAKIS